MAELLGRVRAPVSKNQARDWFVKAGIMGIDYFLLCHDRTRNEDLAMYPDDETYDQIMEIVKNMSRCRILRLFDMSQSFDVQWSGHY